MNLRLRIAAVEKALGAKVKEKALQKLVAEHVAREIDVFRKQWEAEHQIFESITLQKLVAAQVAKEIDAVRHQWQADHDSLQRQREQQHGAFLIGYDQSAPTLPSAAARGADDDLPGAVCDFSVRHVCLFLRHREFSAKVVEAVSEAHITGALILEGITEVELAEIGITSQLLRRSIVLAFADLVRERGPTKTDFLLPFTDF
jgi:hypothetical protein